MSYVNELKSKHGGLTAHIVKTEKFKTVSLIFKMLAPLTKDQVTKRALLPHVLLRGTKSHPKTANCVHTWMSCTARQYRLTLRKRRAARHYVQA